MGAASARPPPTVAAGALPNIHGRLMCGALSLAQEAMAKFTIEKVRNAGSPLPMSVLIQWGRRADRLCLLQDIAHHIKKTVRLPAHPPRGIIPPPD